MKSVSYKKLTVVSVLPSPSSTLEGVMVELSTDQKPYYCDGVRWVMMGTKMTVGTSAPSSPSVGDIWIDTN